MLWKPRRMLAVHRNDVHADVRLSHGAREQGLKKQQ